MNDSSPERDKFDCDRALLAERDQFDCDMALLGWRVAMYFWLENRTSAPKIIGWEWTHRRSPAGRGRSERQGQAR